MYITRNYCNHNRSTVMLAAAARQRAPSVIVYLSLNVEPMSNKRYSLNAQLFSNFYAINNVRVAALFLADECAVHLHVRACTNEHLFLFISCCLFVQSLVCIKTMYITMSI